MITGDENPTTIETDKAAVAEAVAEEGAKDKVDFGDDYYRNLVVGALAAAEVSIEVQRMNKTLQDYRKVRLGQDKHDRWWNPQL
jgi:hypothetical protein